MHLRYNIIVLVSGAAPHEYMFYPPQNVPLKQGKQPIARNDRLFFYVKESLIKSRPSD